MHTPTHYCRDILGMDYLSDLGVLWLLWMTMVYQLMMKNFSFVLSSPWMPTPLNCTAMFYCTIMFTMLLMSHSMMFGRFILTEEGQIFRAAHWHSMLWGMISSCISLTDFDIMLLTLGVYALLLGDKSAGMVYFNLGAIRMSQIMSDRFDDMGTFFMFLFGLFMRWIDAMGHWFTMYFIMWFILEFFCGGFSTVILTLSYVPEPWLFAFYP